MRRSRRHAFSAVLIALLLASGIPACSGASKPSTDARASAGAGASVGAQTVVGKAPAATGGYPSIVILEPVGGADNAPQTTTPEMDQIQETFVPSILMVRTGQPVAFLNHDDVLHNVRVRDSETRESAFNVAIPTGEKFLHTFMRDGFYDVGCDIHPGMSAQIVASASPYAVVADPSGDFMIANVPNGPYKATAYAGARQIEKDLAVAAHMAAVDLARP
jgi:plastocyanin